MQRGALRPCGRHLTRLTMAGRGTGGKKDKAMEDLEKALEAVYDKHADDPRLAEQYADVAAANAAVAAAIRALHAAKVALVRAAANLPA